MAILPALPSDRRHHFARFSTKCRESQDAVACSVDEHFDKATGLAARATARSTAAMGIFARRYVMPRRVASASFKPTRASSGSVNTQKGISRSRVVRLPPFVCFSVYAILEGALEIVVANAQNVKKVPGRKTDIKDAEWIADLLCHGLLRSSFVPPKPVRELRDLTRYRRKLVESQAAERNRLLKLLETANIKLSSVATDVFGMSGRLMLRALVEGKTTHKKWPS
jgi:Transposase